MKKPFCKDVFGNDIFLADTTGVKAQSRNIDRLLLLIGKYTGWGDDISHVWVSDESSIADFYLSEDNLAELSGKIGFTVSDGDYLKDIAAKMPTGA